MFSRERFTTGTAYRGFVTKSGLLEMLFTPAELINLIKVGGIQRAVWGFLGKQVLQVQVPKQVPTWRPLYGEYKRS